MTAGFRISYGYAVSGPERGTTMADHPDKLATHNAAVSVLYGEVAREIYDLYDPDADTTYHIDRVVIDNAKTQTYEILSVVSIPFYADHATIKRTFSYTNQLGFESRVEKDPAHLIKR